MHSHVNRGSTHVKCIQNVDLRFFKKEDNSKLEFITFTLYSEILYPPTPLSIFQHHPNAASFEETNMPLASRLPGRNLDAS